MSDLAPFPSERCFVPGCPAGRGPHDTCDAHAKNRFAPHARTAIPNDGVIDRVAIELAAQGARAVNLTWMERDIAAGLMLSKGATPIEVAAQLGQNLLKTAKRRTRIYEIADAIRREGGLRGGD